MTEATPPVRAPETGATLAAPRSEAGWVDVFWNVLLDARPLVGLAALLLAFLLVSLFVPQMPGQLRSEPLAADRWLTTAAEPLGASGALLRTLGMFDVLHNPIFHALLWVAIFILLVQAAHAVLVALHFRRLPAVLDATDLAGGDPLPVSMPFPVFRWRGAAASTPVAVSTAGEKHLRTWASHLERRTLRVAPAPAQRELAASSAGEAGATVLEERLLALRGLLETTLRPLLPAGMILALGLVWWYSVTGHQFTSAALLPGEHASDTALGVAFEYALTYPQPGIIGPVLHVNRGETRRTLPLAPSTIDIDGVVVAVQPGAPALLVRTLDDAALLAQPGQVNAAAVLGLDFPNPGSEQSLVMPQHGVGMRIIRQDGAPADGANPFVVEVFQGDSAQPVQRFTVNGSQVERIETPGGTVPLGFIPLPMFQVQAYSALNGWLLVPVLALVIGGALGFRRKPAFLLAQAGPWPIDRSVTILQSDSPAALAALRQVIEPEAQNVNTAN